MATFLRPVTRPTRTALRAVPALVAPASFLLTVTVLSAVHRAALAAWGWTPLDHHGVPWPSSLALLPGGELQTVAFAVTGAALVALATALPRGRRAMALALCGAGLVAAASRSTSRRETRDRCRRGCTRGRRWCTPAVSWWRGWPGCSPSRRPRRRADLGFAALLALVAALGGTPGWYAYLIAFFIWVTLVAGRTLAPAT